MILRCMHFGGHRLEGSLEELDPRACQEVTKVALGSDFRTSKRSSDGNLVMQTEYQSRITISSEAAVVQRVCLVAHPVTPSLP